MKRSKRYKEIKNKVESRKHSLDEAISKIKELATAKFNESVDLSIKLNIDPKKTDQLVRGISNLPHGTGKKKKILVLTKGEKERDIKKMDHKRILVTSALPYANGPLHIGQIAGAYLPADIYVRYQRLQKRNILFICGSDEHGVPITIAAEAGHRELAVISAVGTRDYYRALGFHDRALYQHRSLEGGAPEPARGS